MRRLLPLLPLALLAVACGGPQAQRSTSSMVLRGEAGLASELDDRLTVLGAASAGFATGRTCCAFGAFVSGLGETGEEAENDGVDAVLGAGLEIMTMSPWWDWLGFQLRLGSAGTRPTTPRLGRRGYTGSGVLVFRLSDPDPPHVSTWAPLMEATVGAHWYSLDAERSAAGSPPIDELESERLLQLMVTLRFGASYGLELK